MDIPIGLGNLYGNNIVVDVLSDVFSVRGRTTPEGFKYPEHWDDVKGAPIATLALAFTAVSGLRLVPGVSLTSALGQQCTQGIPNWNPR